jgi:hypothetical protein
VSKRFAGGLCVAANMQLLTGRSVLPTGNLQPFSVMRGDAEHVISQPQEITGYWLRPNISSLSSAVVRDVQKEKELQPMKWQY